MSDDGGLFSITVAATSPADRPIIDDALERRTAVLAAQCGAPDVAVELPVRSERRRR